jgi:hypothetical protein
MKTRGLLVVVLMAAVAVYVLYFAKLGSDKGGLEVMVDKYAETRIKLTRVNLDALSKEVLSFATGEQGLPEDMKQLQRARPGGLGMGGLDAWGRAIRYEKLSDTSFRLRSAGPDGAFDTADDIVKDY